MDKSFVIQTINTIVLLFILVRFTKAPLRAFVTDRHTSLRDELTAVSGKLKQSKERFEEFSAKLKAIEAEVTALRNQARQDAESMKVRTLADAKRLSETIVTDARAAAQGLYSDLRAQLRTDLAEKVLDRAERLLRERLTGEEKVRIRREFSKQVEAVR
jgi:F-type H+-transporting ATPase subunit b